ncbi:hypothetical protein [Priestia aryabhattai]|uniref:hypothetical protein n=1 Tax=Priestia aryabhattai TaxID=412384 RepID=UPI003C8E1176
MNYYSWKAVSGNVGNVYAHDEEEAILKVETLFDLVVSEIELLEEGVRKNRFTGRYF